MYVLQLARPHMDGAVLRPTLNSSQATPVCSTSASSAGSGTPSCFSVASGCACLQRQKTYRSWVHAWARAWARGWMGGDRNGPGLARAEVYHLLNAGNPDCPTCLAAAAPPPACPPARAPRCRQAAGMRAGSAPARSPGTASAHAAARSSTARSAAPGRRCPPLSTSATARWPASTAPSPGGGARGGEGRPVGGVRRRLRAKQRWLCFNSGYRSVKDGPAQGRDGAYGSWGACSCQTAARHHALPSPSPAAATAAASAASARRRVARPRTSGDCLLRPLPAVLRVDMCLSPALGANVGCTIAPSSPLAVSSTMCAVRVAMKQWSTWWRREGGRVRKGG
jgi:hypothetical protein